MPFDAGSVEAVLRVRLDEFDRDLSQAERRVADFERAEHRIPLHVQLLGTTEAEAEIARLSRSYQTEIGRADQQITRDIQRRSASGGSVLGAMLGIGGARSSGGGGGGGGTRGFIGARAGPLAAGISSGIGPGILGVGGLQAAAVGGGAALLGALPAAGAIGAGLGVIGGGAALLIKQNQQVQDSAKQMVAGVEKTLTSAAAPMIKPLEQAFAQIPKFFQQIGPQLRQMFAAAAPLIAPLLNGLEQLVRGLLPGLVAILHAAGPAFGVFAQVLGTLGRDLGQMLTVMAPAIRSSAVIFKALADVIGALFPIVGKLAATFATALAPVVTQFAGVIRSLLPFLTILGNLLASFAQAVFADLVAAFTALAHLLQAVAPALAQFAGVISRVFTVLENSGVFAILGNALEAVVQPLARLISALLHGLTPILPPVISFISRLSGLLVGTLAGAIVALMPALIAIVNAGFRVLAAVLPVLLPVLDRLINALLKPMLPLIRSLTPVITLLAQLFGQGLTTALLAILKVGVPILTWVVDLAAKILTWLTSTHLIIPVLLVLAAVLAPVPTLIAAIGIAIGYLATHWKQIWQDIKNWAQDAWTFMTQGWGKWLIPGITLIRMAVQFLRDHWSQMWAEMKRIGQDFYNWIWNDFGAKIWNFLTVSLPNAFKTAVSDIGRWWNTLENVVKTPVHFLVYTVLDSLIDAFDWVTSHIGLGKPIGHIQVAGLQGGGLIPGFGGGDQHPALLEGGEAVIDKHRTAMLAPLFRAIGVPGFASGGLIPGPVGNIISGAASAVSGFFSKAADIGKITAAITSGNTTALVNALMALFGHGTGGATAELGQIVTAIPQVLTKDIAQWLFGHYAPAGSGGLPAAVSGPVIEAAKKLLAAMGWASQFPAFNSLVMAESGWRWNATNPSSGAYGIPQALPPGKMASAGADWRTNPDTQLRWMMGYIRDRYGSPDNAWAHEQAFHWYGDGLDATITRPTVIGVGERGPEDVSVTPARGRGSNAEIADLLRELVTISRQAPAQTGRTIGDTLNGIARGSAYKALSSTRGR